MSLFSKRNVEDAVAPQLLEDGVEYEMTILGMEDKSGEGPKGPWENTSIRLACMAEPNSTDVYVTFWPPKADASASAKARSDWELKSFMACFGLEPEDLANLEDRLWAEKTGFCVMKQKPRYNDPETIENVVKTWKPQSN